MSFILHVNWHIIQPEISSFQKLVNSLSHYLWNGEGVKIGEGININKLLEWGGGATKFFQGNGGIKNVGLQ